VYIVLLELILGLLSLVIPLCLAIYRQIEHAASAPYIRNNSTLNAKQSKGRPTKNPRTTTSSKAHEFFSMDPQGQQWATANQATANQREGQLLAMLEELRTQVQALQQRTVIVPATRTRQVLPEPDRFTGRTKDWDTWSMTMRAKLRIDGDAIGSSEAQLYYVYSSLGAKVQSLVLTFVRQAQENNEWQPLALLEYLGRIYDDPSKVQKAGQRLLDMRQESVSIAAYLPQFERVLYEAGVNTWPDNAKITALVGGLNKYTRQRIDGQLNLPADYNGFVRMLQTLGNQFGPSYSNNGNGNAMEWETVKVSATKSAPGVSRAQRQEWRDKGKCVRCGSGKHWVKECPYQPTRSRSSSVSSTGSDKGLGSSTVRVGAVRIKTTAKSMHLGKDKGLSRTVSESEDDPWKGVAGSDSNTD
jgi:hypothetical protein